MFRWVRCLDLYVPKGIGGMGFRECECFSDVLLLKQWMRSANNPMSLVARTLEAKYFSNYHFVILSLGGMPLVFGEALAR